MQGSFFILFLLLLLLLLRLLWGSTIAALLESNGKIDDGFNIHVEDGVAEGARYVRI